MTSLRIGVSIQSAYPVKDVREGARWMVDRARAAESAGLDSLFVGDHHATPLPYFQNSPMLGRMLAEWGERPAGALYLLPLWNPVLLAEQVGTLASIARGRFIVQCAVGRDDEQFPALGANPRMRPSRFEESLDVLRKLWAGEAVDSDGRWRLRVAQISPVPPEPVDVWIGAVARPAIDRAARLGDGWLASPHLAPDGAREQLGLYLERCEVHGRRPSAVAIRRDVYVGASDAEAAATTRAIVERGHRGFGSDALVIGGPASVAAAFKELAAIGYTDVIVRNIVGDQALALDCLRRLGEVRERVADD